MANGSTRKHPALALVFPEGLLVVAAAAVTAALAHAPEVLVPGALAYAALALLRRGKGEGGLGQDELDGLDERARGSVERCRKAAALVRARAAGAGAFYEKLLAPAAAEAEALADKAAALGEALTRARAELAGLDAPSLGRGHAALEQRASLCHDEAARGEYERALLASRERLSVAEHLARREERLEAELCAVEQALEAAAASLLRIGPDAPAQASAEGQALAAQLAALAGELSRLDLEGRGPTKQ